MIDKEKDCKSTKEAFKDKIATSFGTIFEEAMNFSLMNPYKIVVKGKLVEEHFLCFLFFFFCFP